MTAALILALAGCGSSSLSETQLRSSAARICQAAQRRTERISTPAAPAQAAHYLARGAAALDPAVTLLRALHPPAAIAARFRSAVDASTAELEEVRSALRGLKAGDDPVVEIKTLQHRLAPLERRGNADWTAIDVPACVSR
jgi:hypothetical protein